MPRIFSATYTPYTYEELAAPVREATAAHQKVEEDYNNNMLVVDSLRQRAASEPDALWAKQITDYANKLEGYAEDLARNGLTRETRNNLLNMKRGYGTTVSPVLMAMQREKELQTIRDKSAGTNMVFGAMPTIDEIIANPNIGQSSYNGDDLYKKAHDLALQASKRNVQLIQPQNYNTYLYEYGKQKGFTNDQINTILNNEPEFAKMFGSIVEQSGFGNDARLSDADKNRLFNSIVAGALTGFDYDVDMHYAQRPDYHDPMYWLNYEEKKRKLNGDSGYPGVGGGNDQEKPVLVFGHTVDPRKLKQNDITRNSIISNKDIVTSVNHTVNGYVYDISDDYVSQILNAMNGKSNTGNWSLNGNSNPFAGPMSDPKQTKIEEMKRQAGIFGINKGDTKETAVKKIQNFLQNTATKEDLADATLHTNLQVRLNPSDYDEARSMYDGTGIGSRVLMQDENGKWIPTGKKDEFNPDDYNPSYVEIGLNGLVQVWKKKSGKDGEDIVVTPFYNTDYANQIYSDYMSEAGPVGLNQAYNKRNRFNANAIRTTYENNIKTFDDDILRRATVSKQTPNGYTKGDIKRIINSTSDYSRDNRELVNFINSIEQKYYAQEEMMYLYQLQDDPENQELLNKYQVAHNRLVNAQKEARLMMNIIDSEEDALIGIQNNILQVVAPTKKVKPEEYGGEKFNYNN